MMNWETSRLSNISYRKVPVQLLCFQHSMFCIGPSLLSLTITGFRLYSLLLISLTGKPLIKILFSKNQSINQVILSSHVYYTEHLLLLYMKKTNDNFKVVSSFRNNCNTPSVLSCTVTQRLLVIKIRLLFILSNRINGLNLESR